MVHLPTQEHTTMMSQVVCVFFLVLLLGGLYLYIASAGKRDDHVGNLFVFVVLVILCVVFSALFYGVVGGYN
jgi:hypothetical protein